ncbi:dihydroorotate dehydrogenase electron transfer subunit [Clostridium sp. 19966]|uniref:dihydroorotate dehydrogenase electron transfer subunit n=1 Tax=Clostridium sp. 19966 TaxID=2768166 RepID=UPI0028DD4905|nr:dihydroorotate dehydrogenase electron transfer subunit [Clostridium sp. 19966]MDT8719383.1 dihydroorotate dehydrogenase electron transfer subunit [Clostridium sp. 19966]
MPQSFTCQVVENEILAGNVYKLIVAKDKADLTIVPGQFYMLKAWDIEPLLGRPISICEVQDNKLVFLYAAVGVGTEIFTKLGAGDKVSAIGPLGNGFDAEKAKGRVALVAGGIGIAPMVELSKKIKAEKVDVFAGFRSFTYGLEELESYVNKVHVATEDGSEGSKGYVTDIFDAAKYDVVLCCGPEIMMNKVVKLCREAGTKVYVSMEKHMACGVGACLVCTCKTKKGNKRTCKDGPVFDGDELDIE